MKKSEAGRVLCSTGWLSSQSAELQREILRFGQVRRLKAGEAVHHSGDCAGGFYGLVTGGIATYLPVGHGAFQLATILRPGHWFGISPLMTGNPRSMTFQASESSSLLSVSLADVNRIVGSDVTRMRSIATLSEQATEIAVEVIQTLLIRDTDKRIAATLLRVSCACSRPITASIDSKVSQSELAEMANTSRHSVSRALSRLENKGWIEVTYRQIRILKFSEVKDFVFGDAD